ncbi:MAG: putative DNA binding domain-containing protein [Akkermansia sp.]
MPSVINIQRLISENIIESNRIEYKSSWNPKPIYRTMVAFANDFENLGGGYIVVGIEEEEGLVKRPVKGVVPTQLDGIMKDMLAYNKRVKPELFPHVSVEELDGKQVLLIWVPGGTSRPYSGPEDMTSKGASYHYYIRYNSSTIIPNDEQQQDLFNQCNRIPFDDRPHTGASMQDISPVLVHEYLQTIKSKQADYMPTTPLTDMLARMDLLQGPAEFLYPKNVALMMFAHHPEQFFPKMQVELVIFPKGRKNDPDNFIEVPPIRGTVDFIIRSVMSYLNTNVICEKVIKVANQSEAVKCFNYPYAALEEAVVNALYHRDYQLAEPVEMMIQPHKISITSWNGPDRSVKLEDLVRGEVGVRRYRNRKLGDFLKELRLTEGRGTGIPTILKSLESNGSGSPVFDFGEDRSYFLVEIPCHPLFNLNGLLDVLPLQSLRILRFLKGQKETDIKSIFAYISVSNQSYSKKKYLQPLLDLGLVDVTVRNKIRVHNQQYYLTDIGQEFLLSVLEGEKRINDNQ